MCERQTLSSAPVKLPKLPSRADIAALPLKRYAGSVEVVICEAQLAAMAEDLADTRVVGFDSESRPAFRKGEVYLPSLVQVATARKVYLLPLKQLDFAQMLARILNDPTLIKAGIALHGDLAQLKEMYLLEPAGLMDLGRVAKRHGCEQTGLRNLAARFLGWRIAKGAQTSNWAAPQLSPSQITYAATDAWVGRELYLCFSTLGWVNPSDQGM